MTTRMAGKPMASVAMQDTGRWLPPANRIVSSMQSDDAGRRSITIMAINQHSLDANRGDLVRALKGAGFQVQRESADAKHFAIELSSTTEDAQLIVSDAGAYRSVVLTRMNQRR